jgi:multiple sugar transport system ATP-binding protein
MAEVVLDRVCKQFAAGGPLALRDLSLRVADGELVALVGPSGCGKSTLLRLIAGLEEATRGEIRIGGRDMRGVPPRDRGVAMVFQDSALYPHLTAAENMAFALRMRRVARPEIDRRVIQAAAMLKIADLLQRKPGTLSGGQRQRIALGRAIVRLPEANCLLLDEPLSHLDADLRAELREEIRSLHAALKPTMIFVTHDALEASGLAQRVVRMADGSVVEDATMRGSGGD